MNQKLRDDMMFFYGNLDGLFWHAINNNAQYDMISNMKAQYESILKRIWEDFEE
jgi:hypothetical protein